LSVGFDESDLLPISAIQHLLFCERQAALIHVERLWAENELTVQGKQLHERADSGRREMLRGRGRGVRVERNVPLRSFSLGLWGKADVVEFEGEVVRPVEYKRGKPKRGREDEVQLAAQAMCLEEMLDVAVPEGVLFYGQTRERVTTPIDGPLRERTRRAADRLHELMRDGITPTVAFQAKCRRCSMLTLCQPASIGRKKGQRRSAASFAERQLAAAFEEAA
jgi:CRISPR-associated exonuclease Cas4